MKTVVRFRTDRGLFAVPVQQTRAVWRGGEVVPLPEARPDVAGVVPRPEGPLTVLRALGADGGGHVLVLDVGGRTFGLLVEEVTGLQRIDESEIGPPPAGQDSPLITGVVASAGEMVLLLDANALARRLEL